MKHFILSCALSMAAIATSSAQQTGKLPVYLDNTKPVEQRIDDAIARMTLQEKIRIIHAQSKFSSAGVPRLGFYGAQNEAYKCPLVENVVNDLCFS